jgi:acyl-coenzyme A synthetase/AMP-(fatty) acid ligase
MAPLAAANEQSISLVDENNSQSICALFKVNAHERPDSIACSQDERCLTYGELDAASISLAALFDARGVSTGDEIPIFLSRCFASMASILALLRLGVCFVPMDAESWSQARVDAVLRAIEPKLVVMSQHTDLETDGIPVIKTKDIHDAYHASGSGLDTSSVTEKIDRERSSEEPLYIIFTSGTTGTPKGVVIPLRCIENYVRQGSDQGMPFNLGVNNEDKVLLLFSLAFDG